MIPLFKTYVHPDALLGIGQSFVAGYIGEGPKVDEFEKSLRPWIGENIPVNSGTSALWLAYDLAEVYGEAVITTPITCLATNVPLAHMGCTVIWADCDPVTGLIDPDSVRRLLRLYHGVKAVMVVDYGGQLPDLANLSAYCEIYGAKLIEDCAHSFGAYGQGKHSDFECYSFQAIKHLTTGDGGALVCKHGERREKARLKRWFGLDRAKGGFRCEQVVTEPGYKFHMNDIAASIGLANLPHVQKNIDLHRKHAHAYNEAGLGFQDLAGSNWIYTVLVSDRDAFIQHMAARGIQCARVHSSNKPHPIFRRVIDNGTPGADEFDRQQVSIPVGWWLSDEDVQKIIGAVQEFNLEPRTVVDQKQPILDDAHG